MEDILICQHQEDATRVHKIYKSISISTNEERSSKLSRLCPNTIVPKK